MDEQQFAQKLLALLNRNPNINLAEYFKNDPAFQELTRITQFRHYREDEQQQRLLKILIPALIESVGMQIPGLVATKELFIPALIQKTQAEYGQVAVLFGTFKFFEDFPEELCRCKKYQPLQDSCALTCSGDGMFDEPEDCAEFKSRASGGTGYYYYSVLGGNNEFSAGKISTGNLFDSVNIWFIRSVGGDAIVDCLTSVYNPATGESNPALYESNYPLCSTLSGFSLADNKEFKRWVGASGARYSDSEVDIYYAGDERWMSTGTQVSIVGWTATGIGGNPTTGLTGYHSINYAYPNNPISQYGLAGQYTWYPDDDEATITNPGYAINCGGTTIYPARNGATSLGKIRRWTRRRKINSYQAEAFTIYPPNFPSTPTPWPTANGKYVALELFVGGDREVPIKLGEYLIRTGNASIFSNNSDEDSTYANILRSGNSNYADQYLPTWLAGDNLLLPDWIKKGDYGYATEFYTEGATPNQKTIFNSFRAQGLGYTAIPNFRAYVVKLSETETEICVKYQTFKKFKRFVTQGTGTIMVYDTNWCEITVFKINKGAVSQKTYKYPEVVSADPRNWAKPYFQNWTQKENDSSSYLYTPLLDQKGDLEDGGFWRDKISYSLFTKQEMTRYLHANLLWKKSYIMSQSPENYFFSTNPKSPGVMGVNFRYAEDKLYAFDIKPNQSFKLTKPNQEKEYISLLPEAIKQKTVDAYVRYGELERIKESAFYEEVSGSYPAPYTRMEYNTNYDTFRSFQFKSTKIAKIKIWKIPESFIFEISAFVDPAKLETSGLALPPLIYETEWWREVNEGDRLIDGVHRWLENSEIHTITNVDINSEENFCARESIDRLQTNQHDPWGQNTTPIILTGCNNETYTFPDPTRRYRIVANPIVKGYCES